MLCGKVANIELCRLCSVCKPEYSLVHLEVLHDFRVLVVAPWLAVSISSFLSTASVVFGPMSQYHFHFYGGGPSGPDKEGIVVSTTPAAREARFVRSVSHPPPRAPLPLRNVSPRPASSPPGQLSRDRSPDRARSPRRERSPRHHHRSRSRRRQRRHHHTRRPQPAENPADRAPHRSTSMRPGPPVPRPASAPPGLLQPSAPRPRPTFNPAIRMVSATPPAPVSSPERPPGQWTPALSQRPLTPGSKLQFQRAPASCATDPQQVLQQAAASFKSQPASSVTAPAVSTFASQQVLQPAAEAFRSQPASSANAPAVPANVHSVAPVTPPKNPPVSAKGPPRLSTPSIVDDELMFQATHRSTYEQLARTNLTKGQRPKCRGLL